MKNICTQSSKHNSGQHLSIFEVEVMILAQEFTPYTSRNELTRAQQDKIGCVLTVQQTESFKLILLLA